MELVLAPRWRRLLATLIDLILVFLVGILIMLVTGVLEHAEDWAGNQPYIRIVLLGVCSYYLLNSWLLWKRGQTIGKWVLRIAIVSTTSGISAPFWKLICLRSPFFLFIYLSVVPPLILLPLIDHLMIVSKTRRCLHDFISGTSVILLPSKNKASAQIAS